MTVKLVAVKKIGADIKDTCLMFDYATTGIDSADFKSILLLPMIDGVPILVSGEEFKLFWEKFIPSQSECALFDMLYPEARYQLSDYSKGR